ncbi:MAG: hypothetical protein QGH51_01560 [Planctomycetota bacterium]|jgi:hypothetical protein|nr:hypothetical protein [Planctomycetota bacterium]
MKILAPLLLASVFSTSPLIAQRFEDVLLTPKPFHAIADGYYGHGVAIDGDLMVIGSSMDAHMRPSAGGVTVYHEDLSTGAWIEDGHFHAADARENAKFGMFVWADAQTRRIGVGARGDQVTGATSGSAYIYKETSLGVWELETKLIPPDSAPNIHFGASIVLDGDWALVGAYKDDTNGEDSGSAYFFKFDPAQGTWLFHQKLMPPDAGVNDRFGRYNSLRDGRASIGASRDDDLGDDCGSVYVYVYNPQTDLWDLEEHVFGSDTNVRDRLGISSSIQGDTMVAGAFWDNDPGASQAGSAYVFHRDPVDGKWKQTQKIVPPDSHDEMWFGSYVMLEGDLLAIGAFGDDIISDAGGSTFIYKFDAQTMEYKQVNRLFMRDVEANDWTGRFFCLDDERILIGNRFTDSPAGDSNIGSAGIYRAVDFRMNIFPKNVLPGSFFSIKVKGGKPNASIGMAYTFANPAWGVTWLFNPKVSLDLQNPAVAPSANKLTNSKGEKSAVQWIPASVPSGMSLAFQAFQDGQKSNVSFLHIQ